MSRLNTQHIVEDRTILNLDEIKNSSIREAIRSELEYYFTKEDKDDFYNYERRISEVTLVKDAGKFRGYIQVEVWDKEKDQHEHYDYKSCSITVLYHDNSFEYTVMIDDYEYMELTACEFHAVSLLIMFDSERVLYNIANSDNDMKDRLALWNESRNN